MASELTKYRAQIFQLGGFALMTPLGNLIVNWPFLELPTTPLKLFLYVCSAVLLFYLGMIFWAKGEEHLKS